MPSKISALLEVNRKRYPKLGVLELPEPSTTNPTIYSSEAPAEEGRASLALRTPVVPFRLFEEWYVNSGISLKRNIASPLGGAELMG